MMSSTALSANDIRKCARRHKEQWRVFLRYVERIARASRTEKIPDYKRGYLVYQFAEEGIDVLLNLSNGKIYKIADDNQFKHLLMNHSRTHPDERRLLEPVGDELVLLFAERMHKLKPKFVRELFDKNADTVHPEWDEDGAVCSYHYILSVSNGSSRTVVGVVVFCKDKKPSKAKQSR